MEGHHDPLQHLGEERYRRLVESVQDYAIFLLAPDGTIASWNAGAERLKGYRAEEIIGRSFACFYTDEDQRAGKPQRALERAAAEGRLEDEGWRVRKDGSRFWANVVLTAVREEAGALLGFAKVTRDFTERRQVEDALRRSEQRLRVLFDHAGVGILEVDRDDRIAAANERMLQILGYRREALLEKTIHEITHPGDRAESDRVNAELHEGRRVVTDYEKRYLRADGTPVRVHVRVAAIRDPEGRWIRSVGTVEDVTEARETQRALREERDFTAAVLDTTAAVVVVFDPEGRIVRCNRACEAASGFTADELRGMHFSAFVPEEELDRVRKVWDSIMRGAFPSTFENHWRSRDGTLRRIEFSNTVLTDAAGRLRFVVSTGLDVTQRAAAEAELRRAEEQRRLALRAADLGTWDFDVRTGEVYWDERYREIHGVSFSRMTYPDLIQALVHPDDRGRIAQAVADALDPARPDPHLIDVEYRVAEGGGGRWVHVKGEAFFEGEGARRAPVRFVGTAADVTAAKRAAEEQRRTHARLRASEERHRLVSFATHDVVWDWDLVDGKLEWNEAMERTFGYRLAEITGDLTWWADRVHPDDLQGVLDSMRAAVDDPGRPNWAGEYRFRHADGRWVDVLDRGLVARDEQGRGVRMVGSMVDLTERKEAERRLRRVLEASPMGAVLGDVAGRILFANDAYLRVIGHTRDELARGEIWWDRITPPEHLAADRRAIAEALERGVSEVYEKEYLHSDGSRVPVLVACASMGAGELAAFTLDITDRKRAEQALAASEAKFRAVFERAAIGMGRVRFTDACWEDVNDAFCRMLGRSREEMLRTPWPEMTHPDDVAADLAGFRRLAAGELQEYTLEKRFLHARGHEVWARLTLSVVTDAQGRPDHEIAIIEDIGERKRAQAELRAVNERLRETDRRKNDFLAMLSHELRNPLAPIKNSLFVLERAPPGGAQARRSHEVIGRQVQHLTRLVDDLLDVTRISRGKVRLQRERVDLRELLFRTAEDHRSLFHASEVELRVEAGEPVHVTGDPTRLSQIVGNLLSNAAKFTGRGGRVELHLEREPGAAVIRVRDDGVGIPPELLGHMFEPFVQADATLDRSKGGLGLGLALVKGLAELHGGAVSARSAGAGTGAEFTVRVPAEPAEPAPPPRAAAPRAPRALRVLLIEDNADAAESLKEALELNGHTVEIARSGWEGLEKARAAPPEVVLCDIGLPGIDGFEVARRMRADPALRSAPLVALSGYAGPEDLERSRDAGFLRHLAKPPDLGVLEHALLEVREERTSSARAPA